MAPIAVNPLGMISKIFYTCSIPPVEGAPYALYTEIQEVDSGIHDIFQFIGSANDEDVVFDSQHIGSANLTDKETQTFYRDTYAICDKDRIISTTITTDEDSCTENNLIQLDSVIEINDGSPRFETTQNVEIAGYSCEENQPIRNLLNMERLLDGETITTLDTFDPQADHLVAVTISHCHETGAEMSEVRGPEDKLLPFTQSSFGTSALYHPDGVESQTVVYSGYSVSGSEKSTYSAISTECPAELGGWNNYFDIEDEPIPEEPKLLRTCIRDQTQTRDGQYLHTVILSQEQSSDQYEIDVHHARLESSGAESSSHSGKFSFQVPVGEEVRDFHVQCPDRTDEIDLTLRFSNSSQPNDSYFSAKIMLDDEGSFREDDVTIQPKEFTNRDFEKLRLEKDLRGSEVTLPTRHEELMSSEVTTGEPLKTRGQTFHLPSGTTSYRSSRGLTTGTPLSSTTSTNMNSSALALSIAGPLLFFALVGFFVFFCYRKLKSHQTRNSENSAFARLPERRRTAIEQSPLELEQGSDFTETDVDASENGEVASEDRDVFGAFALQDVEPPAAAETNIQKTPAPCPARTGTSSTADSELVWEKDYAVEEQQPSGLLEKVSSSGIKPQKTQGEMNPSFSV